MHAQALATGTFRRLLLGGLLAAALALAWVLFLGPDGVHADATSTSFSPTTVNLPNVNDTATITVSTVGVDATTDAVQINVQHSSVVTITSTACAGIFTGASSAGIVTVAGGQLIGCFLNSGDVSGTTGDVMTFVIKRLTTGSATLTFGTQAGFATEYSNGGTPVGPGNISSTVTIPNNAATTLTVNKVLAPAADAGKFNLTIDGATAGTGANAGNGGTTGAVTVTAATHTVGETAGTGTTLANYTTVISGDCAANGTITLASGDAKVCTITNTRMPTLTVNKVLSPTSDTGKFNLRIDGTTAGTGGDVGNGGTTGAVVTTVGSHTVSETAGTGTSLSNYTAVIGGDCAANGAITLAAGDNKVCTITNTRIVTTTLTVNKVLSPGTDTGKFNLQIDGATAGTGGNAGNGGTTGAVTVAAGAHTVSEVAVTPATLTNYTTLISGDCAASGAVTLAAGDNKVCTITNTRLPTLRVNKVLSPSSDTGKFNLQIDGVTQGSGANVGDGGTTGVIMVSIGQHLVGESAGTGTSLANYTTTISGDCAANGTITLAAGDNKVCTITNTVNPPIPSLTEWGMIGLGIALAGAMFFTIRRRTAWR